MQKLHDIYALCLSLSKDDFKTYYFQSIKYFNVKLLYDKVEIVCHELDGYTYIHITVDEIENCFRVEIMSTNKGVNRGGLTYRQFYNLCSLKEAIKIPQSAQTSGIIKNYHSRENKKFIQTYFTDPHSFLNEFLDEKP
jgi:hypothetical protein